MAVAARSVDFLVQIDADELVSAFEDLVEERLGFSVPLRLEILPDGLGGTLMLEPAEEVLDALDHDQRDAFLEHPEHDAFCHGDSVQAFWDFLDAYLGCDFGEVWGEFVPGTDDVVVNLVVSRKCFDANLSEKIAVSAA